MKEHCNVLLLALSTFPYKLTMSENKFKWENGKEYTRIYQLDPVPKMLADQLAQKHEYLDKIILLATKSTLEEKDVEITDLDGKKDHYHGSPLDYFKSQIDRYMNPDTDPEEKFVIVPIDEKNIEQGISDTIEKVRKVKNIKLYLDTHGGFREIFLVAEAVISLLKVDKIEVQGIYGVEHGEEKRIVDGRSGFHIFDFVSGMNEFINYGRIDSLEAFLKKHTDNDLSTNKLQDELILCMKKISEGIQLCSIAAFEQGLHDLTEYYEERKKQKDLKSHSYLFIFAENIKKDYGVLLTSERTVIDEIKWCREKGFYQQVLTLIESRVPQYLKSAGLCEYHLKKDQDETRVFNQCAPWRYDKDKGHSQKERLEKMNGKWFPRKKGKYVKKDEKYVDYENADIWMMFHVSEEKRILLDEFFQMHMKLKGIRNHLNHALNLSYSLEKVDEDVEKYLEMLGDLCK